MEKPKEIFNENEAQKADINKAIEKSENATKDQKFYKTFETKSAYEDDIKRTVSNKMKEIETLKTDLATKNKEFTDLSSKFENINNSFHNIQVKIKNNLKQEWQHQKLPDIDFDDIDLNNLDFSNAKNAVFEIAKNKGIEIPKLKPKEIKNIGESSIIPENGAIVFGTGAMRKK